jgi:ribosomal protein S19E (S16A)
LEYLSLHPVEARERFRLVSTGTSVEQTPDQALVSFYILHSLLRYSLEYLPLHADEARERFHLASTGTSAEQTPDQEARFFLRSSFVA